jgi:hypothetical protein
VITQWSMEKLPEQQAIELEKALIQENIVV